MIQANRSIVPSEDGNALVLSFQPISSLRCESFCSSTSPLTLLVLCLPSTSRLYRCMYYRAAIITAVDLKNELSNTSQHTPRFVVRNHDPFTQAGSDVTKRPARAPVPGDKCDHRKLHVTPPAMVRDSLLNQPHLCCFYETPFPVVTLSPKTGARTGLKAVYTLTEEHAGKCDKSDFSHPPPAQQNRIQDEVKTLTQYT